MAPTTTAKKAAPKRATAASKTKASTAPKKAAPKKTAPKPEEEPEEVEEAAEEATESVESESAADTLRKDDEPLYNSYRPTQFSEVVGQKSAEVLRRSVQDFTAGRTYLFAGPRGTGKTTCGRLLAASLLSRSDEHATGEPDLDNPETMRIINGESMFVNEIDCGRNSGVDDMTQVLDNLRVSYSGKHRVVIFDEAHLLSPRAVSAALKSLEEFKNVTFILCTTNPEAFPDTIRSRALVHNMTVVDDAQLREHLTEVIEKERERYAELGRDDSPLNLTNEEIDSVVLYSGGSVRDALSGLQTIVSGGTLSFYEHGPSLVNAILSGDLAESFAQIMESNNDGTPISGVAQQSISFLGSYMMYCVNETLVSHRDLVEIQKHDAFADREYKVGEAIRLMRLLVDQRFGVGSDPTRDRQLLELSIVTFANPDTESIGRQAISRIEKLDARIDDLFEKLDEVQRTAHLPGGQEWPPTDLLSDDEGDDDNSESEDDADEDQDDAESTEEAEPTKAGKRRRREIVPQSSGDDDSEDTDEAAEGDEGDDNESEEESDAEGDSDAPGTDSEPDDEGQDDSDEDDGDEDAENDVISQLLDALKEDDDELYGVVEPYADDIRMEDESDAESPLLIPAIPEMTDELFNSLVEFVRKFFGDDEMEVNEDS